MTPGLTFVLVFVAAVVWFLLPLIPALRELLWPTDIAPLKVMGRDAANVALFALVNLYSRRFPNDSQDSGVRGHALQS
jgi:hypothetical protein